MCRSIIWLHSFCHRNKTAERAVGVEGWRWWERGSWGRTKCEQDFLEKLDGGTYLGAQCIHKHTHAIYIIINLYIYIHIYYRNIIHIYIYINTNIYIYIYIYYRNTYKYNCLCKYITRLNLQNKLWKI